MGTSTWPPPFDHWLKPEDVPLPRVCICKGIGFYRVRAPLGHPLFGKGIPCICKTNELARKQGDELRRWSGLSTGQLLDFTFEAFDPGLCVVPPDSEDSRSGVVSEMRKIKSVCSGYALNPKGWLVLIGRVGSGKSHLACAIVNSMIERSQSAHIGTVAAMLDGLRAAMSIGAFEGWWRRLKQVRLLVLDDLGAERETDWATEKIFELVDQRYVNRQPLVVTTNLGLSDERFNPRLASRLQEGAKVEQGWVRVLALPAGDIRPVRVWKGA